jgi:hypothetical protein
VTLGPATREGEQVFGVAHIFASFNDTFIVSVIIHFSYKKVSLLIFVKKLFVCFPVMDIFEFDHKSFYCLKKQHVTDLSGGETLVRITGMCDLISNCLV